MRITYYGTAAGEAWPGVFCQCELCREARRLGGKNIRTRSQALIDDDLLLDLPPDNYLHSLYYGLDPGRVKNLLITHSHADHCYTPDLELLREPFSHTYEGQLQVYGNETVRQAVIRACGSDGSLKDRFMFHVTECNRPIAVGDYTVVALRATHARQERCLFYRIAKGDQAVLYAHDTGAFTQENLDCLAAQPGRLSLVSLDCTCQKNRDGGNHMGLLDAAEQKERLLDLGLADEKTVWVLNHFSHNGGWLHEEMSERAQEYGMIAAYDGMVVEF